jgi:hypothetical protein
MRRRDFITLLGGSITWPLAVRADALRRLGLLFGTSAEDAKTP